MIFNAELNKLPKRNLIQLLEFIDSSLKFSLDEPFSNLTNPLKPFILHDSVICGYVEVKDRSLSKIKRVVNVSYPKEWIKIYFNNNFQLIDPNETLKNR